MSRPSLAEMDHINLISGRPHLRCTYCLGQIVYAAGATPTLADIVQATADHKAVCPNWPSPRPVMAGQTAIPLPE